MESMQEREPKANEVLQPGSILLVDQDQERIDYITKIFHFIDFNVNIAMGVADIDAEILSKGDKGYLTLLLSPDLNEMERSEVVSVAKKAPIFPALFQLICNTKGDAVAKEAGSQYLGIIDLPLKYEALIHTLYRSQLFQEQQSGNKPDQRPVELFRSLTGNSRATNQINKMISQVANTDATVLILGESGTGKEVVARKLHYNSDRRKKAFVPINCGAIPSDLLESELFGHEKGAFTGAISSRQGRFELAEGGTLFLDEIGDMSMPMQVKLLRVLQERSFERVGSNKTIQCDVRIIAATHRNLEQAIVEEKFREDLYYRLNVFPIEMPALRERIEDIPVLVNDLISRIEIEKRGSVRLTPGAVTALTRYSWPGNVRELANLIERLAILYPYGVVEAKDLPEKFRAGVPVEELSGGLTEVISSGGDAVSVETMPRLPIDGIDLKAHLNGLEISLIKQALDESDGVVAHAAKRLNMRRTTLVEKLRKYGLQRSNETT